MADEVVEGAEGSESLAEGSTDTAPAVGAAAPAAASNGAAEQQQSREASRAFAEMRRENAALKTLIQEDMRRRQVAEQSRPRESTGPVQTQEEREAFRQAGDALERILSSSPEVLERILGSHPKLKALMEAAPQLVQGYQTAQGLQQQAGRSFVRSAQASIKDLTARAGLPATPEHLQYYEDLVWGAIRRDPDLLDRYKQLDVGAVAEAFAKVEKSMLSTIKREGAVGLQRAKDTTNRLPIPARGGTPGLPAAPEFTPGKDNPRDFEKNIFKRARDVMRAGVTG